MNPPDILTMVSANDPILREITRPVEKKSLSATAKLADSMLKIMYSKQGVGLAAPQVGISLQMFVMNIDPPNYKSERVVINPKILHYGYKKTKFQEGCLSLPNVRALIERPTKIVVEYSDLFGEVKKYVFEGLTSRVFQHETDHLNGIMIVDRMSKDDKQRLNEEFLKLKINPIDLL